MLLFNAFYPFFLQNSDLGSIYNPRCFSQNFPIVNLKAESLENPHRARHFLSSSPRFLLSHHLKTEQVWRERESERKREKEAERKGELLILFLLFRMLVLSMNSGFGLFLNRGAFLRTFQSEKRLAVLRQPSHRQASS